MSSVGEPEGPVCPVHPYGYHRRPRVRMRGTRVLTEMSAVVLPARCAALEREVDEADRVDDFVRQLWVTERAGHGGPAAGALLGALSALLVLLGHTTVTGTSLTPVVVLGAVGAALAVALVVMKIGSMVHEARLRRVYAWREYVGFQV